MGIVSAIAAPAALEVTFEGQGGHAGGQLMHSRCESASKRTGVWASACSASPEIDGNVRTLMPNFQMVLTL